MHGMKSATSFTVRIWIAGDYRDACRAVKDFCQRGDCYSVAPCDYIYTGGAEAGVCVTRINYPRYPEHHDKILLQCVDLAEHLRRKLFQDSYSIETPDKTYWFSRRITSDGVTVCNTCGETK